MSRRKKKRGLPLGIALAVLVIGLVYAGVRGLLPEELTQVLQDSTASQEPSDSLEGFSGEAQVYYIDVGQGDSDSLFDLVQQVFPQAVRLIRRDEAAGETGFTVEQISQRQLEEKLPALQELGLQLANRITIADF